MKPTPFNRRHSLRQAQQSPVAHHEEIEANYAYLETQDSSLHTDKFNSYLKIFKRRKRWIIFTMLIIIPIMTLQAINEEKMYISSAKILIEDVNQQILNIKEITMPDKSKNFFQTEYNLIRIKENIEEAVDILQLDKEVSSTKPAFMTKIKALIELPSEILSLLKNKMISTVASISENSMVTPLTPAEERRRQAIAKFYKALKVESQEDTKLVDIRFSGPDPQLVAQQANTLAEIYIRKNLEKKLEVNRKAQAWLIDQIEELQKQIHSVELKLQRFREEKKFISLDTDEKRGLIITSLNELNLEHNKIRQGRINIESLLSNVEYLYNKDNVEIIPSLDSSTIISIKQKLLNLKDEYSGMLNRYKEDHPIMIQKRLQMDEIRRNIGEELKELIKSKKIEYNILLIKELALEKEINKKKIEAIKFDNDMTVYNALKRDVEIYKNLYSEASQRLREIKLTQAQTTSNITIVEKASVPIQPVSSKKTLKILLSFIISCSIGIGFAFIREYFDTSLKDIDDVERYLQIPCLSVIPSVPSGLHYGVGHSSYLWTRQEPLNTGRKRRAWTSRLFRGATSGRRGDRNLIHHHIARLHNMESTVLEAYSLLRTRLQSSSPDVKTLLVTSAVPLEGKSTITIYLGMAFARLGRKVLLVDTDLRQPALHGRFRVQNNAGLADILAQGHDWQQVIRDTPLTYLQLLPAGAAPHGYPSDVLSLAAMQRLVEHLRNTFDLVIFDAPSGLSLSDAEILAPTMDGVLLVHSPGKCTKEDVLETTRIIHRTGSPILGIVLNNISKKDQIYHCRNSHSTV